jgi:hypothetical protein
MTHLPRFTCFYMGLCCILRLRSTTPGVNGAPVAETRCKTSKAGTQEPALAITLRGLRT